MFKFFISLAMCLSLFTSAQAWDRRCNDDWTGFYVGGYVGGAWGRRVHIHERTPFNPNTSGWDFNLGSSWIAGPHLVTIFSVTAGFTASKMR